MRAVLDTNVWISGALTPGGTAGRILEAVRCHQVHVISSLHLWGELRRALSYPKTRKVLERDGLWGDVELFLSDHSDVAFVEAVEPAETWVPDDPDDNWVIQCALTANADYIVSADQHLLSLGHVGPVQIVSPREFVSRVLETL